MSKSFIILLLFNCFIINAQIDERHQKNIKISETIGDLDKDGISEKVEVWNTSKTTDFGIERQLRIFKKQDTAWVLWLKSNNCLLASENGGMMGDPFESIEIKNGILIISHNGGSSWKWGYQDKYRYQNKAFELIGHTGQHGKPCEYWASLDFNLSTGKIFYKKDFETCTDKSEEGVKFTKTIEETFLNKTIKININNRYLKEYKIITPKNKIDYYL